MTQTTTRAVGVLKYMQKKSFAEGFKESREGKPFDYARVSTRDDFAYEVGRQFGVVYYGRIKDGNTVDRRAAAALLRAINFGEVVV